MIPGGFRGSQARLKEILLPLYFPGSAGEGGFGLADHLAEGELWSKFQRKRHVIRHDRAGQHEAIA